MSIQPLEQALGLRSPFANVTYGSATQFRVQINETTRIVIDGSFVNPSGGGPYTGSYSAPQFGTISKITIQAMDGINGNVLGSEVLRGSFARLEAIFNDAVYPVATGRNANSWNPDIPDNPPALVYASSTKIAFLNTSGAYYTVITGTGFTFSPSGSINGGTATHIGLLNAAKDIETTPLNDFGGNYDHFIRLRSTELGGPVDVPLLKVWDGLFDVMAQQRFYAKLFVGVSSVKVSGDFSAATGPFDAYIHGFSAVGDDANDTISGGIGNDTIRGGGGNDNLKGLMGNDVLYGDSGTDTLNGGLGNDKYYLDHAGEVVIEGGGLNGGFDWIYIPKTYNMNASTGAKNVEAATLTGSAAANISGNALANTLNGNTSANVLTGGLGRDLIAGKGGADRFDFNSVRDSGKTAATRDFIKDFSSADVIDLSAIDANGSSAGDTFSWRGKGAFTGHKGDLHYVRIDKSGTANDRTIIEGDVTGDGVADFQIELKGLFSLTASVNPGAADIIL